MHEGGGGSRLIKEISVQGCQARTTSELVGVWLVTHPCMSCTCTASCGSAKILERRTAVRPPISRPTLHVLGLQRSSTFLNSDMPHGLHERFNGKGAYQNACCYHARVGRRGRHKSWIVANRVVRFSFSVLQGCNKASNTRGRHNGPTVGGRRHRRRGDIHDTARLIRTLRLVRKSASYTDKLLFTCLGKQMLR
jgi:hypothetical protein